MESTCKTNVRQPKPRQCMMKISPRTRGKQQVMLLSQNCSSKELYISNEELQQLQNEPSKSSI
jgi:hypothetical protein